MIASVMSVNAQGGYRGFFEVIPSLGHGVSFDVITAHGWQFNQNWFLGAGVGAVNILGTNDDGWCGEDDITLSVPIFAKIRFDLLSEKTLTWFADLNIGCSVCKESEYANLFYSSFSVGMRQQLTEQLGLNYGIGCSLMPAYWGHIGGVSKAFKFNVKVGIDF